MPTKMEHRSADPYEQQLLKVFNSYDHDNKGSLDREGLSQLCLNLQLEEQSNELIACLLKENSSRATFLEFKDALLALLGKVQNKKSHQNDENLNAENASPEREVSPKFVYGSKKYGRRSRPRSDEITPEKEQNENTNYINKSTINVGIQKSNSQSDMSFSKKRKTNSKLKRCTSFPGNHDYEYKNRGGSDNSYLITSNNDNEQEFVCTEEMLRAAWKKLGVGEDGYLNQTELILVCDAIGLHKLADGVLRQLSNKLAMDYHRKISFQELLEALQQDDAWSDVLNCTIKSSDTDGLNLTITDDSVFYPNGSMVQYITLGPDGTGLIGLETVVDMWENAGITLPKVLLSDLGFKSSQINVSELAAVLEKEIKGMSETQSDYTNPHIALLQAFSTLYQSEIRCLKNILEQMHAEREKLKCDVLEANKRATMLAQEVDDNHAKMEQTTQNQVKLLEQRHSDILKELSEQFNGEKEHLSLMNKNLEDRISCLENAELKLQSDLQLAQKYSHSLEKENQQLRGEINELQKIKHVLSEEINVLENDKQKRVELEKEQLEPLLSKLSVLQVENSKLRDKNDEMLSEIENLSGQIASMRPKISSTPTFNNLEQYMEENVACVSEAVGIGSKRRSGDSPSKDLNAFGIVDGSPRLGKVRKFQKNKEHLDVPFTSTESGFDVELDWAESSSNSGNDPDDTTVQLQARIAMLEQLLTKHSIAIPSSNLNNSNQLDHNGKTLELTNYCKDLEMLVVELTQKLENKSEPCCENCDLFKDIFDKIHGSDKKMDTTETALTRENDLEQNKQMIDESTETNNYDPIQNQFDPNLESENKTEKYLDEIKELTTKVNDLENCIDLLKNEYEKCEDYWTAKLDEERLIYEQEQNLSTEKLNELIMKIEEYEKQFSSQIDLRLPPIEEKYSLEKQFTDLEQEFEDYKLEMEMQLDEKNNEIFLLREKLSELSVKQSADVQIQVDISPLRPKKQCNLSNHVVESTNLFSSDTMPYGWNQNHNNSEPNSLETTVIDNSKQRDYVNPATTWNKSNSYDDIDAASLHNSISTNDSTNSLPLNSSSSYNLNSPNSLPVNNPNSLTLNNSNLHPLNASTNSLPLNVVWQNSQTNLKPTSFSLLNLNTSTENNAPSSNNLGNSTPCRPKRTRKYERSPLSAQRLHKKGNNNNVNSVSIQDKESKLPLNIDHSLKTKGLVEVPNGYDEQTCVVSVSAIHGINARVHHLEQRCRHLQMVLKQQHYQAEQMLQHCWQHHRSEKVELQFLLKSSQEKLDHHLRLVNEQQEKLARSDMLVKELYVENSYLIANVQRLEQQCHMLAQCNSSNNSV